jgi:hypothetical protein
MRSIHLLAIIFILNFLTLKTFCQSKTRTITAGRYVLEASPVDTGLNNLFFSVGEMPVFPGGIDSLIAYAKKYLYYPETALKDSVQGTVLLDFVIDMHGKVINETAIKKVRLDLDTLCLSMLRNMPDWIAGKLATTFIDVRLRWPITFIIKE